MLLNTALSVRDSEVDSHAEQWRVFTDAVPVGRGASPGKALASTGTHSRATPRVRRTSAIRSHGSAELLAPVGGLAFVLDLVVALSPIHGLEW